MPKYHIEVEHNRELNRMFRYKVELHDSTRKKIHKYQRDHTVVARDWCNYKFMVKHTAKKLIREQRKKDNGEYTPRRYRL